jgi:hypothetical protein
MNEYSLKHQWKSMPKLSRPGTLEPYLTRMSKDQSLCWRPGQIFRQGMQLAPHCLCPNATSEILPFQHIPSVSDHLVQRRTTPQQPCIGAPRHHLVSAGVVVGAAKKGLVWCVDRSAALLHVDQLSVQLAPQGRPFQVCGTTAADVPSPPGTAQAKFQGAGRAGCL